MFSTKHLVANLKHLHPSDEERIRMYQDECSDALLLFPVPFGAMLYVGNPENSQEDKDFPWLASMEYKQEGWKTDFQAIARLAWKHGCTYVTFDDNAPYINELKDYSE